MIVSPQVGKVKKKSYIYKNVRSGLMLLIPDDPIIRAMESRGYPPWIDDRYEDEEDEDDGIS